MIDASPYARPPGLFSPTLVLRPATPAPPANDDDIRNRDSTWSYATGQRPPYPETSRDWLSKKEVIRRLYLVDNLPLREIVDIMAKEHAFLATERMYKRRFLEWKWKKYNSKGLRASQAKGLLRSAHWNLYVHLKQNGDAEASIPYLRETIRVLSYASEMATNEWEKEQFTIESLRTSLGLVEDLNNSNMCEEADRLRSDIAASEYLRGLEKNDMLEIWPDVVLM
ncbi:hypothetical protein Cob_v004321 [Colletotrichum orbiculare MAFF 240422]|uniref:Clr5 domain-containing protein n=1 Tax=Colletotrichum orbiculare (strain 104-T / ATCC 96160 / CBS 514.97 / LARS 414 / MAFF 240422) TaxID=1213857 RepID=A0A484FYR8_COLOR|nr:hypothetical protein Cob_v004321 [Colletotrichum orbiculare MAFF 240422]